MMQCTLNRTFFYRFNQNDGKKKGLLSHWQFENNTLDIIGGADMYGGANFNFINDRFNRPLSAISLNTGYLKIPASDFFGTGKFSILAWVKARNLNSWSRLVDFGLSGKNATDSIILALSNNTNGNPTLIINNNKTTLINSASNRQLNKAFWEHLTATYDYPNAYLYINGTMVMSGTTISPISTVIRDSNYLGRSYRSPPDINANADIDDLKIYNRALSQQEILDEMNN
jgi:hypothetical protein